MKVIRSIGWPVAVLACALVIAAYAGIHAATNEYVTDDLAFFVYSLLGSTAAAITNFIVWIASGAAIIGKKFWIAIVAGAFAVIATQSLSPFGWHDQWMLTAKGAVAAVLLISALGVMVRRLTEVMRAKTPAASVP